MKQKDQHAVILNDIVNYLKSQHKIHSDLLDLENPAIFESYYEYNKTKIIKDFIEQLNKYLLDKHNYSIL